MVTGNGVMPCGFHFNLAHILQNLHAPEKRQPNVTLLKLKAEDSHNTLDVTYLY